MTTTFQDGALYLDTNADVWRADLTDGVVLIHVKRRDDSVWNPDGPSGEAAEDVVAEVGEELAAIGELLGSAIHQGPDSHARHEYDTQMQRLVDTYADGGLIPLYGRAVGQLRDACARIAAPRPVPAQERRRTA
ncbi:hypothetical protein [Streptomyces acidiscabies]|uniref:hypothetical protein n=1 Tax=Streptomyces acidiscabies TaxID=42234 RepID=UPI00073ECCC1|nr:hypothetical protein [Streptomyces acidiscabies]GAQ52119.1 hypothetical protein a10_01900 [Streptomyces acidiscabies]